MEGKCVRGSKSCNFGYASRLPQETTSEKVTSNLNAVYSRIPEYQKLFEKGFRVAENCLEGEVEEIKEDKEAEGLKIDVGKVAYRPDGKPIGEEWRVIFEKEK